MCTLEALSMQVENVTRNALNRGGGYHRLLYELRLVNNKTTAATYAYWIAKVGRSYNERTTRAYAKAK